MANPDPQAEAAVQDAQQAAARWFARFQLAPERSAQDAAFQAWLRESPLNQDAWRAAQGAWTSAALIKDHPAIARLRFQARVRHPRRRVTSWALAGATALTGGLAAAALVFVITPPSWRIGGSTPEAAPILILRSDIQPSVRRLADGSTVTLDAHSIVEVTQWGGERGLRLRQGRAYFEVAKDKQHPFVVIARDKSITAVGTAFAVDVGDAAVTVDLIEGRVKVERSTGLERSSQVVAMVAGQQLVASAADPWRLTTADMTERTAWTRGQAIFNSAPLGEAVAELNRYSTRKLILGSPGLSTTTISGVFKNDDAELFARALESYGVVKLAKGKNNDIILKVGSHQ